MARADFYILNGKTTASKFSCFIANKAWSRGNSIYILTRDPDEASKIDDLLWTYQDTSFLPHASIDNHEADVPVVIGWSKTTPPQADVMINLTDSIPEEIDGFQRVIEIIAEDKTQREQGRQRYKAYQTLGFEIFNHEITAEM
ncbi:MAG: DNA polymerase III subunit chi [Gammaproteobacteria bacterium]|jgi:DNA polymerase-3 subunit chi